METKDELEKRSRELGKEKNEIDKKIRQIDRLENLEETKKIVGKAFKEDGQNYCYHLIYGIDEYYRTKSIFIYSRDDSFVIENRNGFDPGDTEYANYGEISKEEFREIYGKVMEKMLDIVISCDVLKKNGDE